MRPLAGLLLALAAGQAAADSQSKSFSRWTVGGARVEAIYRIPARELGRLPGYRAGADPGALLAAHLAERLWVEAGQRRCEPLANRPGAPEAGHIQRVLLWQCAGPVAELTIGVGALFAHAPGHIHFARIRGGPAGDSERLFTRKRTAHSISLDSAGAAAGQPGAVLPVYLRLGFEHILGGVDHIAFLLTLLVLARRLRDIALIVTGFTLGHSLTLTLTVLGLASPRPMVVEAFIGFTIALVAVENVAAARGRARAAAACVATVLLCLAACAALSPRSMPIPALLGLALFSYCHLRLASDARRAWRLRPAVTGLFGMVHGFGFANVLLEVGLPGAALAPALLGFNLGVELGQFAIVALLAAIGWLARRLLRQRAPALREPLNAGLCGLGCYWLTQRLLFA